MDTLSHALIGVVIAGFSGHSVAFSDPIYWATVLGAQAPDFDIIAYLRGNFSYIRQHRSFSHSIPGVLLTSCLLGGLLHYLSPQTSIFSMFSWSLLGGLSHIFIDYFNTHGAALFWPLHRKRKSYQILNVFDPILMLILIGSYVFPASPHTQSVISVTCLFLYLLVRICLRKHVKKMLLQNFQHEEVDQLTVMPSLKRLFYWDFVLTTKNQHLVGQINTFYHEFTIHANLAKQREDSPLTKKAQKTFVGDFFTSFSPLVYFEEVSAATCLMVTVYDLRYILNRQFLHRATILFDHNQRPTASFMYSYGKIIKLPC